MYALFDMTHELFLVQQIYSSPNIIMFFYLQNEVEYAQFLIEEFDSGFSKDLKTGHTKRSYLSEKLICAPMRVSKKFPGKSIGKTNFSRTSKGPDGNPLPSVVLERYELRHQALRIKFLRKILTAELKVSYSNFPSICLVIRLLLLIYVCSEMPSVDYLGYQSTNA